MKIKVVIQKVDSKGVGVFANRDIAIGEVVVRGKRVKVLKMRTNHSFQFDFKTHLQLDKLSRSINHSCEPNTGVLNNHLGAYDFIALRAIKRGEEITWDYETTEYVSISVRHCLCGSVGCRGETRGYKYLPKEIREKYGIFVARYLYDFNSYTENATMTI